MSEKFTKGPWLKGDPTDHAPHCIDARRNADGRIFELCSIWGVSKDNEDCEQAEANAYLIAAAPDMYALLKKLQIEGGLGVARHREIDRILAEARGEA